MSRLFVVNNPKNWPLHIPGVDVVSARSYLTDGEYSEIENAKVFNLCRSYRYMSSGYYVSLLAEARGHRAIPSILTLQDMRSEAIFRIRSEDLDDLIQRTLSHLKADRYQLNIYFGKATVKRYDRLAQQLFSFFEAPLLRAHFHFEKKKWELDQVYPIAVNDIPDWQRAFVVNAANEYFVKLERKPRRRGKLFRYDLAILYNPDEADPPSDPRALRKFCRAAEQVGMDPEFLVRDDYRRVAEFDALFIRETTAVNHHTYRFARRAAAEGLAVIDDPESIIRCTNKVYLAEMFDRYRLPTPKTMIVHRDNASQIADTLNLPCILKQPDSSFSQGVVKVNTLHELREEVERRLEGSDLLIAQEFMPTDFDWRVGVLEGKALYVCRYFMARRHWQILKRTKRGSLSGKVETLAVPRAPRDVVRLAVAAASAIGDGFYGVDLKQRGSAFYLIEVNDNPSVDAGYEDKIIGDKLYSRVMKSLVQRIERIRGE